MWIIPKNLSDICPSVQDTEGSTLDSEEFCQSAEQSLMWRSKPSQYKTWLTRLKRNNWMQHLFTRTLKHSRSESFEDAWTSSLGDSPANLSQMLGQSNQQKTLGISSPISSKESESADPQLSFLRMSKELSQAKQEMENLFSSMSLEAWKKWVTEQRQEYSQRQKLAHRTRENESLSWATPNTMDHMAERSPEAMERQFATHRKGRTRPSNLREQVNWPTATVAGLVEGGVAAKVKLTPTGFKAVRENGTEYGAKLRDAVETYENWPKDRKGKTRQWATPTSRDWKGSYKPESMTRKDGKSRMDALPQMAEYDPTTWPTPATRDYKGANGLESTQKKIREGKRANMGQLPNAIMIVGHQDQTNPNTSGKNPVSLKLNPNWVEQLMGLPVGWTQIKTEQTD